MHSVRTSEGAIRREEASHREAAALLRALAHPVRLEIVALLAQGEACVCHLQTLLRKRQPYISQQLMALRDARLVDDRRDGAVVYYRLAALDPEPLLGWVRAELARQRRALPHVASLATRVEGCPCPRCAQAEE